MKYRYCIWLVILAVCGAYSHIKGDDIADNTIYVKSSPNGHCYAKAIPDDRYGSKGVTKIYAVRESEDRLIEIYPWYAQQIDLQTTAWGVSVVRIGTWHRGQGASKGDLAIGLYLAGKTLKEYSTLDLALALNSSDNQPKYFGILKAPGYRWRGSNNYVFDIETGDGKTLSFDVKTGELLKN